MNAPEVRAELENDLTWRQDEIRFFQNQAAQLPTEQQQNQFRRAVVMLLYAHFEGYCKFALSVYVNAVNRVGIQCHQANYAIAASSLADVLSALRHPGSKCDEFRNALPDDAALHLFAREREFIERIAIFDARPVAIPDTVVDMESNLKPVVLRKNLFRLGLALDTFEPVEGQINRLLQTRNGIAHGVTKAGLELKAYEDLRDAVNSVMQKITAEITSAIVEQKFLRAVA
jgi:hypothetical protein